MQRRNFVTYSLLLGACVQAQAQTPFPSRAITLIVPFPPGGLADIVARPVAEAMARDLGQPVVIENKPGAGGGIGMGQAAKARPDGYTILLALSSLTVLPEADALIGRAPMYALADLRPLARFTADPTVLAVRLVILQSMNLWLLGNQSPSKKPQAIASLVRLSMELERYIFGQLGLVQTLSSHR